MTMLQTSC